MDDKAKRRLSNRSKTNHQLFTGYYDLLKVKLTPDQFKQYKRLLDLFHAFVGEFPPSEELGLKFLAQYATRARATMVRYTGIIRGFMEWYGEDFNHRPRRPKKLPQWVNPDDIEKLKDHIRNKKTAKKTTKKDLMLIDFACKTGLRRKELAYSWQKGFPRSVTNVFRNSGIIVFENIEMLVAFPEYKVPLKPYGSRASQNDLFVLAKGNDELVSIMVEGKVDEPFGDLVAQWKLTDRGRKKERLEFVCHRLRLNTDEVNGIRYQLLHRAASAVIEAGKFTAKNALMLIHIFEKGKEKYKESLRDYQNFTSLFSQKGEENKIIYLKTIEGIKLYGGWVKGEKRFLTR